jgi:hypothetical protein
LGAEQNTNGPADIYEEHLSRALISCERELRGSNRVAHILPFVVIVCGLTASLALTFGNIQSFDALYYLRPVVAFPASCLFACFVYRCQTAHANRVHLVRNGILQQMKYYLAWKQLPDKTTELAMRLLTSSQDRTLMQDVYGIVDSPAQESEDDTVGLRDVRREAAKFIANLRQRKVSRKVA